VTAIQMAAAVAAIANGGYLMRPLIVRRVEDSAGAVFQAPKPVAVRRVIEPETADTLTEILKCAVSYGTGKLAAVPGYTVAGKTGTAQKVDGSGRYSREDHIASFVGFAPASRPELTILISIDTPRGPRNYGGDVAAPVFARIAEQALQRLAVPPDDPRRLIRVAAGEGAAAVPAALHSLPRQPPVEPRPGEPALMPDLAGWSAREAAAAAAALGLIVEISGSGRVEAQQPRPGVEVQAGRTCVLQLSRSVSPAQPLPPRPEGI
jgi:cell division protein FtsI (penicillin-binding protein 3)